MTVKDAAKALRLSREMVVKLCNQGKLVSVRTAGNVRLLWQRDVVALHEERAKARRQRNGSLWRQQA